MNLYMYRGNFHHAAAEGVLLGRCGHGRVFYETFRPLAGIECAQSAIEFIVMRML